MRAPATLVDVRDALPATIEASGDGLVLGAGTLLAELVESPALAPYAVVREAASLAASPLLRNRGTLGGNLCQAPRCWYLRGPEWTCWLGGGEQCYAQLGEHRKHGLEPGDCISAHPSDLAPALAACGASVEIAGPGGLSVRPLLDLYRRPTAERRTVLDLAPGELVTRVLLPAPPQASTYRRLGERQAFSFPLLGVAAARAADGTLRVVAAGVANVPLALAPGDPLRDLPGDLQTAWKRKALATLVARALEELA